MFEPKNPDGSRKKVTLFEVSWRICAIFGPFIFPYMINTSSDGKWVWGVLWIAFFGPFWFCLHDAADDEWEESAKPFKWIFDSIPKLFLGLIILSGLLFVLFGRGRY